ncbi:hypothetical protein C819_03470 [Lachnospiraceae bacterium 10-1]|nr:hypothetical protein C819_03470 [Lachnospiraceae bacterium 10-1]
MANKDYTYNQVKAGTGKFEYEENTEFYEDIRLMQHRLSIAGYEMYLQKFTGIFDENTRQAVIAFQKSCQLLPDGIVGKNTLVQLDKVSVGAGKSYFLVGGPIEKWDIDTILYEIPTDDEILSRIIWTEEHGIYDAQTAVAKVLQNRFRNPSFQLSKDKYPNSRSWPLVVCAPYQYAAATSSEAKAPLRGDPNQSDGVDIYWKHAVDLARLIMPDKINLTVPKGYSFLALNPEPKLSGYKNLSVSDQVYQTGKSIFEKSITSPGVKDAVTYDPDYQTNKWVNVFYNLK